MGREPGAAPIKTDPWRPTGVVRNQQVKEMLSYEPGLPTSHAALRVLVLLHPSPLQCCLADSDHVTGTWGFGESWASATSPQSLQTSDY